MGKYKPAFIIGILVLIAVAAVYYFFFMQSQHEEVSDTGLQEESSAPAGVLETGKTVEPLEVDLEESDALVRKLAEELSAHPQLARWLITDQLIRRFVATVDLIARGDSPRRPMDFIQIDEQFMVREERGSILIDPESYRRYNHFADVISSLDAEGCVRLYKQLRLPIRQAYAEMGYPDTSFDTTLKKAVSRLLETPATDERIYVEKDVVTYLIVNPELENLSSAQKHLLRMGPDNIRAIQSKLKEIARYIGF